MFEKLKHIPLANAMLRRPPGFYRAARRLLANAADMTPATLDAWRRQKLSLILENARKLPGYAGAPRTDDLSAWPVLAKGAILGREGDFATSSFLPSVPAATGGTTGQPMKLARTWRSVAFEQAVIDHLCANCGIEPAKARIAILRGDSIKPASDMTPPYWIDEGLKRRIFSAHHLSRENIAHYRAALTEFAPEILFCYPSSLATLVNLLDEDCSVKIPLVFASSEMLPLATLQRARKVLSADVIDFYGHAERIACAWSLNGEGYRFLPAYGYMELLPAGEGLARIVATSLNPQGQIFVRYDTGDLARVPSQDPCILEEIARGIRTFEGIEGRDSEFVDLPGGRRIIGLNHIPRGVSGAASIQVHHNAAEEVTLYVTPSASPANLGVDQLIANFRQKFPAHIKARIVFVERPVRERNGKAPLLLRTPDAASIALSPKQPLSHLEYAA